MKKNNFTVTVPFPAWDGIFQTVRVCDTLRRNEMLKGVPVCGMPRRITMKHIRGDDDLMSVAVEYWYTDGCFANVSLVGHNDDEYGTSWKLIGLRLRWRDRDLKLPAGEEKLDILLTTEQIEGIDDRVFDSHSVDTRVDEIAFPIRAAWERQQAWLAASKNNNAVGKFSDGVYSNLGAPRPDWKERS
ncbi:MAG: hypothetical protein COT91_00305 [Candidatus Doudnabacteria bacterium CG10_big_fil_rev_8_21_14_0_10_41_10]|uniref:Uncharacterized protein n=1 Tax=Candidatus Doudnabacteria bacterium CG10_big_fil_rev_8_21_14_0_10_41_10 TaxID=1974551 RepID=A0A2H0VEX2_9BACT|nr:MAG: hypothetical protein COT91_00305 [Candidatus Doudnabacteria bacterium CG10_big_fil_rev_8_21_14_0_10_41_10]